MVVRVAIGALAFAMGGCNFDSSGGGDGGPEIGSESSDGTTTESTTSGGPGSGPTSAGPGSATTATTMGPTSEVTSDTSETQTPTTDSSTTNNCEDQVWYEDKDEDGFGDDENTYVGCDPPDGFVPQGGDCDDGSEFRNPGLDETCDTLDNDCDDKIDEHSSANTFCKGCFSDEADGIAFYVCPSPTRWTIAETACQNEFYGELASIHSDAQQAALFGLMGDATVLTTWTGFNDIDDEGTFVWNDGTAVDYLNWYTTEPDDFTGQDCAILNGGFSGQWFDRQCDNPNQSVSDSFSCADPDF